MHQAYISCQHLINTLLHYLCRVHEEQLDQGVGDMDTEDEEHTSQQSLWVERYAPQRYTDLLSEEVTVFLVALLRLLQQKKRTCTWNCQLYCGHFWGVSYVVYFDLS